MTLPLPRIFVHAPAYRDREMQWTLRDMFEQAAHPERVFAGVCWQTIPEEDADCFVIRPNPGQVREDFVHANEAKGLGWARARSQSHWRGEEYVLQIDSHMRFAPGWDQTCLDMLAKCDAPDPVLTVYPASYTPPDTLQTPGRAVQTLDKFTSTHILQFTAKHVPDDMAFDRPLPTAGCAGGFIFGPSRLLTDVPPDPAIYFIGEEPNLAIRMWTHGFDLFSPNECVIYHYYYRRDGSRHWDDQPKAVRDLNEISFARMRALTMPERAPPEDVAALGRFGLGPARSLAQYKAYAGVDFASRTIADSARHYPWVRTPERRAAFVLEGLERTPGAELLVVGDEGVLFTRETGHIQRANDGATFIWCALEDGWGWDAIAGRMAADRGIAVEHAIAELKEVADHWLGLKLLRRVETATAAAPIGDNGPRLDEAHHDLRTHHYRLLDTVFRVRMGGAAMEALLSPALAHLEVPAAEPHERLDAVTIGGWHHILANGSPLHHGRSADALLPILKSDMLVRATRAGKHLLHLHAAAVAVDGRLVLLPGKSGSGKTLLTAALVHGGARYYSDETVLIARSGGTVRPVPTALSIKADGVDLAGTLFPKVADLTEHAREDGIRVRYMPPPSESIAEDVPTAPSLIVFPRYEADAATTLTPLSPADTLARLLDEAIAVPAGLDAGALARLIDFAERVPAFTLVGGDLHASLAAVAAASRSPSRSSANGAIAG